MATDNGPQPDTGEMAGRLLLVIDSDIPIVVQQACANLAATLADQAGMPVTVAAVPITRLDAIRDSVVRDAGARRREYSPPERPVSARPMSSAPFLWREDGRPDWQAHVSVAEQDSRPAGGA
jgi:hypothetical protein